MYRKALKQVVEDLKHTMDLTGVKSILNEQCSYCDFVNIVNELLNQLSEEHAIVMNMTHKNKKLVKELTKKEKIINKIRNSISEDNIEII